MRIRYMLLLALTTMAFAVWSMVTLLALRRGKRFALPALWGQPDSSVLAQSGREGVPALSLSLSV